MALNRLRPMDLLLAGYALVAAGTAISRLGRVPGLASVAVGHLLIVPLVLLLARPGLGRTGRLVRETYPLVLLLAFYASFDLLNGGGISVHDATVQRWEAALFGGQPSRDWWRSAPSAFWSTVLHWAYWGYYLIVPAPAIWFGLRRDLPALRRYLFAMMAAFVVCYLGFLFYPVAGPYYAFPRPDGEFVSNLPARLVYATLAAGSSYGAAFPSSHVAATLAATLAAWRGSRLLGAILLGPSLLLIVGTVYCQMHYAVDALAGVLVGVAAVLAGRAIDRRVTAD